MASVISRAPVRLAAVVVWRIGAMGTREFGLLGTTDGRVELPHDEVDGAHTELTVAAAQARAALGDSARLGTYLGTVRDSSPDQRPRLWSAWTAQVPASLARSGLVWVPAQEAQARLEAPQAELVKRFHAAPPMTARVVLLRHAEAESPSGGLDEARRLNAVGRARATQLGAVIAALAPDHLRRSPARRCEETLEPAARSLGLESVEDDRLGERGEPSKIADELAAIAAARESVVVCSHAPLISGLLEAFSMGQPGLLPRPARLDAGGAWVIEFGDDAEPKRAQAMYYLPPPPVVV